MLLGPLIWSHIIFVALNQELHSFSEGPQAAGLQEGSGMAVVHPAGKRG